MSLTGQLYRRDSELFSLGLTYHEVMDLQPDQLERFLMLTPREEIIDWLQWNDPSGIYRDKDSLVEFGNILTKKEGIEIIKRQLDPAD